MLLVHTDNNQMESLIRSTALFPSQDDMPAMIRCIVSTVPGCLPIQYRKLFITPGLARQGCTPVCSLLKVFAESKTLSSPYEGNR